MLEFGDRVEALFKGFFPVSLALVMVLYLVSHDVFVLLGVLEGVIEEGGEVLYILEEWGQPDNGGVLVENELVLEVNVVDTTDHHDILREEVEV